MKKKHDIMTYFTALSAFEASGVLSQIRKLKRNAETANTKIVDDITCTLLLILAGPAQRTVILQRQFQVVYRTRSTAVCIEGICDQRTAIYRR